MSRTFVTGATGVLGRRVVPMLLAAGHDVTAVARSGPKAAALRVQGARPTTVDLFDTGSVHDAVEGHDAVLHLATNIPTGVAAASRRGWRTNDRLRTEAAAALSRAVVDHGIARYVHESITFPYVDGGDRWITEDGPRSHFWGNQSTVDAEASARAVTDAGGVGVTLRFAMFMAADSGHMQTLGAMARRGLWGLPGADDAYVSFIQIDDAARAVLAALDVPAGTYNVAEADPKTRGDHRKALAAAAGRETLRPLPRALQRAGGKASESLARSQRISSAALAAASSWRPEHDPIDVWKDIA